MKKIIFILFLAAVISLTGCVKNPFAKPVEKQGKEAAEYLAELSQNSNQNVYCEIEKAGMVEGEIDKVAYWFKDGKIKTENLVWGDTTVQKDGWLYMWAGNIEEPSKLDLEVLKKMQKDFDQNFEEFWETDYVKDWRAEYEHTFKIKCEKNKVKNNDFDLPNDIEFQDMTQIMQQSMSQFQDLIHGFEDLDDELENSNDNTEVDMNEIKDQMQQACDVCQAQGLDAEACAAVCQ